MTADLTATTIQPRADTLPRLREVVAVFDDPDRLQAALDELQCCGFDRAALSTVAARSRVERWRGRFYDDVREIEDDGTLPRASFVSRRSLGDAEGLVIAASVYVFAVGAALAAAAEGAAGGTIVQIVVLAGLLGGLLGLVGARALERLYRRRLAEQLDRGGLVLWVTARDAECEACALRVLAGHGARDLHVHEVAAPGYPPIDPPIDLVRAWRRHVTAWWNP